MKQKYELVEQMLLKMSDALTTTRIGFADGRIDTFDMRENMKSIRIAAALLEELGNVGVANMTEDMVHDIKDALDQIVMG